LSIVIVGGNDCMVCQYKSICKQYNCKVKVFTQMPADFQSQIGSPDLMVLFTRTVSHKMISGALKKASVCGAAVERCHSSSSCALKSILDRYCMGEKAV